MNIPVIYEDDWFFIVNKPAGLLSIPTPRREQRTLTSIVNDDARARGQAARLYPCHRLDRETSGVMVYAKGKSAQQKLMEEFRRRRVHKEYIAVAHGRITHKSSSIRLPLEGKPAITNYRVLRACPHFSIVRIEPVTGRKNQVRIHFKHIGHPLVGETRFAFRRDFALRAARVLLHARSISFVHPFRGTRVSVEAPVSADIQDFMNRAA